MLNNHTSNTTPLPNSVPKQVKKLVQEYLGYIYKNDTAVLSSQYKEQFRMYIMNKFHNVIKAVTFSPYNTEAIIITLKNSSIFWATTTDNQHITHAVIAQTNTSRHPFLQQEHEITQALDYSKKALKALLHEAGMILKQNLEEVEAAITAELQLFQGSKRERHDLQKKLHAEAKHSLEQQRQISLKPVYSAVNKVKKLSTLIKHVSSYPDASILTVEVAKSVKLIPSTVQNIAQKEEAQKQAKEQHAQHEELLLNKALQSSVLEVASIHKSTHAMLVCLADYESNPLEDATVYLNQLEDNARAATSYEQINVIICLAKQEYQRALQWTQNLSSETAAA